MELQHLTITQIFDFYAKEELSAVELITYCIENIRKYNEEYNVFLYVRDPEILLKEAHEADEMRKTNPHKKLLGIPYSLKDSYMATGTITSAADRYLENTPSEYASTAHKLLREEGAILIGKVNMDAWGFGGSTENSSYKITRNPHDPERIPGGSSGGSAASVALDMCTFSIAEDTGGSTRNPASLCGLYGLKPTNGRISRFGCIAFASSLDTIAPIARSAEDLRIVLDVLSTPDEYDMTHSVQTNQHSETKSFAYSYDFIPEGVHEETRQLYLDQIEKFKSLGYTAVERSLKTFKYAIPTYYITCMSEASTNLSRYNGTRYGNIYQKAVNEGYQALGIKNWEELYTTARMEGLNEEAKRRVFLGAYVLSEGFYDAYYKKAQQLRNMMKEEFEGILGQVDFMLSPVTLYSAPKIGERSLYSLDAYLEDVYTVPANLVGIPSVAFPAGTTSQGLPIGMQILGRHFEDESLLKLLGALE
ncbi:MAG: amidase family protein [Candidatus Dojkabacteria bacterium]